MDVRQSQERFLSHLDGSSPPLGAIFVFGSNLDGRHGKGAALAAFRKYGAHYGQGEGPQGFSYAIPTKGRKIEGRPLPILPLEIVRLHVEGFLDYARAHPGRLFFVTRIGCGLAKNEDAAVARLFAAAPSNCSFAQEWLPLLEADSRAAAVCRAPRP
jgi:hypothetical protein